MWHSDPDLNRDNPGLGIFPRAIQKKIIQIRNTAHKRRVSDPWLFGTVPNQVPYLVLPSNGSESRRAKIYGTGSRTLLETWERKSWYGPSLSFLHPGSRICMKEFKRFNLQKTKKLVSLLYEIWSGLFIPDPGYWCWLSTHPGSLIQGSKRRRIPDPDPQHWLVSSWVMRSSRAVRAMRIRDP